MSKTLKLLDFAVFGLCKPFIQIHVSMLGQHRDKLLGKDISHVKIAVSRTVHGDCWTPNAVTQERKVVLIDWECAGQGAAILDLGTLLLRCQYDQYGDIPEVLQEKYIVSVIVGYVRYRIPMPEELDMLLEAMRFSIVWGGAWIVSRTLKEGWTPRVERLLARIQRGYRLAEPTARLARREFDHVNTSTP